MHSGTPLDIKKNIVLLHNNLLVRCKVYSSDPWDSLCTQAEGMVKPMKTLVGLLIQHHVERILLKKNCHTKLSATTTRREFH